MNTTHTNLMELFTACIDFFDEEEFIADNDERLVISVRREDYQAVMKALAELSKEEEL